MITFNSPVTIQQPPYTDPTTNKLVSPPPIVLSSLDLVYNDNPSKKIVSAYVERFPFHFTVYAGEQYDSIGDWTKAQVDQVIADQMGPDPQAYLQSKFPRTLEQDPNGPGTILAGMIKSLGINASPTCSCRQRAIQMNIEGADWCDANIETIMSWLKEESQKRSLPFIDMIARAMVNRAISKSRRLLNKETVNEA
jgi:hypothetical protein